MASSRLFDDEARIRKRNAIDTFEGRYRMDVPGNGADMPFNADPHIRIQKWGANFSTNMMDINSDLRGMTRPLNKDYIEINEYKKFSVNPKLANANPETVNYITDETRATNPAWVLKEHESNRWNSTLGATRLSAGGALESPFINPVDMTFLKKPFYENLNTRILEKDYFKPKFSRNTGFTDPVAYNK
jgi:hypothetical protein